MHTVKDSGDHADVRDCAWVAVEEVSGVSALPLVRHWGLPLVPRLAPPLASLVPGDEDSPSCRSELFLIQDFHNLEAVGVPECP